MPLVKVYVDMIKQEVDVFVERDKGTNYVVSAYLDIDNRCFVKGDKVKEFENTEELPENIVLLFVTVESMKDAGPSLGEYLESLKAVYLNTPDRFLSRHARKLKETLRTVMK